MMSSRPQIPRILLLLLLLLGGAGADKCPDGSDGLTRALYEAGDPTAYATATCIPRREFNGYDGAVTLTNGMKFLISIEQWAFDGMTGKLTIAGPFPLLERVLDYVFGNAGTADSSIDLTGIDPSRLKHIHGASFDGFQGSNVTLPSGPFPNYEGCTRLVEHAAVSHVGVLRAPGGVPLTKELYQQAVDTNAQAMLAAATCIPDYEFYKYKGAAVTLPASGMGFLMTVGEAAFGWSGKITFAGRFPSLSRVDADAFYLAGTDDSEIAITCSSPMSALVVGSGAFDGFKGYHDPSGEQTCCGGCVTTATTTTTTTSTTTRTHPCNSIKCAVTCDGECGWSRAEGQCKLGLTTSQSMIDSKLGDCSLHGQDLASGGGGGAVGGGLLLIATVVVVGIFVARNNSEPNTRLGAATRKCAPPTSNTQTPYGVITIVITALVASASTLITILLYQAYI